MRSSLRSPLRQTSVSPSPSELLRWGTLAPVASTILPAVRVDPVNQCPYCLGVKGPTFSQCAGCKKVPGVEFAPRLFVCSIVEPGTAWYHSLVNYKKLPGMPGPEPKYFANHLAHVLAAAYGKIADEVASELGGEPDAVSCVPSTRGRTFTEHPLSAMVVPRLNRFAGLVRPVLQHSGELRSSRNLQPGLFTLVAPTPKRVVLIEDLLVTGTTLQTALATLREAGAQAVGVVIAKKMDADFYAGSSVLAALKAHGRPAWW